MTACPVPLGAVEIRRATTDDLPRIAQLARHTWRACYPAIITPAQIEYMLARRYSPAAMSEAVDNGRLHYELLTVDGDPQAFAAHGPGPARGEWKLEQLYVHPDWQGRGLGRQLIHHVETLAFGAAANALVLTVNKRNTRAILTYERAGFAVRDAAVFDIGNGFVMDDFVMVKPLNRSLPAAPDA